MKKLFFFFAGFFIAMVFISHPADAQQYKLKQVSNVMGMKSESTIFVKGMRKRTEGGGMMGLGADQVTIEQCDLQRNIKINSKKKLYFIEPFTQQGQEEVIDEDAPPSPKSNTIVSTKKDNPSIATKEGGTITMYYKIHDTGERKIMYGFTARHVWVTQKMKPSADACNMKDSMMIKTDGWYIDLPQYNCPVHYHPARPMQSPNAKPEEKEKQGCTDRFVIRRSGKGKQGFPLTETTTIKMGGNSQMSEIKNSMETLDFSIAKLDSMLFEIPPGYQQAQSEDELREKIGMNDIIRVSKEFIPPTINSEIKKPGIIRIGVYAPTGDEQVQPSVLQQRMAGTLTGGTIEAVAVATEEEAKKLNCDYLLSTEFTKLKPANKIGSILKAIKNADPNAVSNYNIQASLSLKTLADGTERTRQKVDGKYEGKLDDAAGKALDDGCRDVLKAIK